RHRRAGRRRAGRLSLARGGRAPDAPRPGRCVGRSPALAFAPWPRRPALDMGIPGRAPWISMSNHPLGTCLVATDSWDDPGAASAWDAVSEDSPARAEQLAMIIDATGHYVLLAARRGD